MNNYEARIHLIFEGIKEGKNAIIELLSKIETLNTALDEYDRCVKYLDEICSSQHKYFPEHLSGSAAAYLPLNQPLYSFLLFPFTLSLACEVVFFRHPKQL